MIQPRVVVIEYNAALRPPLSLVVPYDPERRWDGSNYFGASLEALVRLGRSKGYRIVGCNFSGANAFFVRDDIAGNHFLDPADGRRALRAATLLLSDAQGRARAAARALRRRLRSISAVFPFRVALLDEG